MFGAPEDRIISSALDVDFAGSHRAAVIDIGSNSGRVVVLQPRLGGHLEVVEEYRLPLRLGAALDAAGHLSDDGRRRTIDAIEDFLAIARAAGAEQITAVGTSALRRATNGDELASEVRERFGLQIEVIDGALEGHYSFLGAAHGLPVESGMLIDIGGGSFELARFHQRRITDSWSFPFGTLRATADYLHGDPPEPDAIEALSAATRRALADADIPRLRRSEAIVGTGGAVRNLAKIDRRRRRRPYPIGRLHGYELRPGRLAKIAARLASLPAAERAEVPGLNPARTETIVAGATVLAAVMTQLRARRLLVSGQGLREGVMRGSLGSTLPPAEVATTLPPASAVRLASVRALLARFARWEEQRSRRHAWTALQLLERTAAPLDDELRELAGYAAMVVDAATAIDFYNREDVAAEIVMRTDLAGFSHPMIARLAALIRLLERPRFDVRRLAPLLKTADQPPLELAAAALALAEEVHRRVPEAAAGRVRARVTDEEIELHLPHSIGRLDADVVSRVERAFARRLVIAGPGSATPTN